MLVKVPHMLEGPFVGLMPLLGSTSRSSAALGRRADAVDTTEGIIKLVFGCPQGYELPQAAPLLPNASDTAEEAKAAVIADALGVLFPAEEDLARITEPDPVSDAADASYGDAEAVLGQEPSKMMTSMTRAALAAYLALEAPGESPRDSGAEEVPTAVSSLTTNGRGEGSLTSAPSEGAETLPSAVSSQTWSGRSGEVSVSSVTMSASATESSISF
jgi:hypothetical protein